MATGRMAHHHDLVGGTAELGGVVMHPADGGGHVVDMRRMRHGRREPIVGADENDAVLVEKLGLVAHFALVALAPFASMEEDDDRRVLGVARGIDVKPLFLVLAVGNIGANDRLGRQHGDLGRARLLGGGWRRAWFGHAPQRPARHEPTATSRQMTFGNKSWQSPPIEKMVNNRFTNH